MWNLFKRLLQIAFFFIWSTTLIYLVIVSCFIFMIFTICLTIFLFWFILTLIGWSIALIPIVKFVFIPLYRRQCRLWTINTQQSRLSISFFHLNCNNSDENARILWTSIQSLLKTYNNDIQIIIYNGDTGQTLEEILQNVKLHFNIDINKYKSSITFIYLQTGFLLEKKSSLLNQHLASILVSFEALIRFIPDVYMDSIGYVFTYPCWNYLASVPIISYIHHSIIPNDVLKKVIEDYPTSFKSKIKLIPYDLFQYVYGWFGRCANVIYCNSLWTKNCTELAWGLSNSIEVIYPPCDIKKFLEIPLIDKDEDMRNTIVSIGEFRPEKNHQLQIRAFHQLLQRKPDYCQKLKLILIGSVRNNQDREYIEQLKILIDDLKLNDQIELKCNISFSELKTQFAQAIIGLHTMKNELFGMNIVEMMAAGVIVIAHKSGAPKWDIIEESETGFLAYDTDSYATIIEQIYEMSIDERRQIQQRARDRIEQFDRLNFERLFLKSFDKLVFSK